MLSPSTRGEVGSAGTRLYSVIFFSRRWWMTSEKRVSTREPGYSPARASWSRSWPWRTAASTRGFRFSGSWMAVDRFWMSTVGARMSTSRMGASPSRAVKPIRASRASMAGSSWPLRVRQTA